MEAKPQVTQLFTKRWRCFNSRRLPLNYYFAVIGASGSLGSFSIAQRSIPTVPAVFSCCKSLGTIVSNLSWVKLLAQGQPVSWQESACLNPSLHMGTSLLPSLSSYTKRALPPPFPLWIAEDPWIQATPCSVTSTRTILSQDEQLPRISG